MKNFNVNNTEGPNKLGLNIANIIAIIIILFSLLACSTEDCEYAECSDECVIFEDFENTESGTAGNWIGIDVQGIEVRNNGGSNVLYVQDGSGGSWAYNTTDFPSNLLAQGCDLNYDVQYLAGAINGTTSDNGILIFSGGSDPLSATSKAIFILNSSNLITSGSGFLNVTVPLELATGTTLPTNSMGTWYINGVSNSTPPTASDIADFNALIQNIDGVAFAIDEGGNPAEQWWFDNFCFKQCCGR